MKVQTPLSKTNWVQLRQSWHMVGGWEKTEKEKFQKSKQEKCLNVRFGTPRRTTTQVGVWAQAY